MALNYDHPQHLDNLEIILHDCTEWFLQVTSRIFYPDENGASRAEIFPPNSFREWIDNAQKNNSIQPSVLAGVQNLYQELTGQAHILLKETARLKTIPDYKQFRNLTVLFEEFMGHLRRLEIDTLMEDSGIDALTGLRTRDVMEKDIKREMDRFARQGKTFAIALVRIDHFAAIKTEMSLEEINASIVTVAGLIKKSMRSFDDAYVMEDGMFILSLKQTGANGGIRALKRLKSELDRSAAAIRINGEMIPLTLSSCIGEPHEGEDILKFIENLKKDLDVHQDHEGSVVEYFELSPLQRYVRDKDHGRG